MAGRTQPTRCAAMECHTLKNIHCQQRKLMTGIRAANKTVVGWSLAPQMRPGLVADALRMAWFRRRPAPGLIVHSDRGSQYCSHEFQDLLKQYGMRSSMSRKGNCWDNAPTESLWGSLKVARLHGRRFPTRREAMDEVIDWLSFYNHRRLHSTLGYLSPMQFERAWLASQQQRAA
ncbi:IS3 family transposase [Ralstonia solanacearum]|uniref:IS3 family transposase n=1 Tax=Ralstonia solanacearum TaxID=305 RepID=UPI002E1BFCAB|nr:IS3 family transposase [Ralstonia solanacearum]